MKELIAAAALAVGAVGLYASPTANAFPITCPGGQVIEFGQFCPLPPWLGGPQPTPEAEEPSNNLPDRSVMSQCSLDKGIWNTERGLCEYPNDIAAAQKKAENQCSLNKGVWITDENRCKIL